MAHESTYKPSSGIASWFDSRLPIPRLMHDQFGVFPMPRNVNYLWTFGAILMFLLITQIATGIVLAMHYVPTTEGAFNSIEKIMRDVNWGWLLRYAHAVGASITTRSRGRCSGNGMRTGRRRSHPANTSCACGHETATLTSTPPRPRLGSTSRGRSGAGLGSSA